MNPGTGDDFRVAWVGVGSELNGDDAAGLWAVRSLASKLKDQPQFLCLESGVNPENAIGPLRKFNPHLVVLIDAADFGTPAGNVRFIENVEIGGISFSTHSLPMNFISDYLSQELGCPVWLLGIQPESLEFDAPLTIGVSQAVDQMVSELVKITLTSKDIES